MENFNNVLFILHALVYMYLVLKPIFVRKGLVALCFVLVKSCRNKRYFVSYILCDGFMYEHFDVFTRALNYGYVFRR